MLAVVGWIACLVGFIWGTIVIHEYGHLLTGRLIGLPRGSARVVLNARPPHVALRTPDGWVGPDDRLYVRAFTQHRDSALAAWFFVGGGLLVETLVVLAGGAVLVVAGVPTVAAVWLAVSTFLIVLYLAADILSCYRADMAAGDYAALWSLDVPATVLFVASILVGRVAALVIASQAG